jgi:hypothetical protein
LVSGSFYYFISTPLEAFAIMGNEFLQGLGTYIQRAFAEADVSTDGIHQFQFEGVLDSEKTAQAVEADLSAIGFTCRSDELEDGRWLCAATQPFPVDVAALNRVGENLTRIIEKTHGGEFNGWHLLASSEELLDPDAPFLQLGQFNLANADPEKYPHQVVAHVLDGIEPVDRGPKYDEKLSEQLANTKTGVLISAGSQLNGNHDVVAVRFEFHLADTNNAVTTLRQALISCGAPIGSTLRFDERVIPVRDERLG